MSQVSSGYETVIGLEVHAQLKTRTKMFCGCRAEFGAPPNTRVCPVCLGLPGALPLVNGGAVELAVRAALGLACRVHHRSVFARKNYFYPDLPKGYQITQYDHPLASEGQLEITAVDDGEPKQVRIRRLHLEEDAGKSLHDRFPGQTAVDLNRAGVPLIEVVSEPDIRSPSQARAYLARLKQTLEYLDVSDCNMEEGSLRVDANVSVRARGEERLGTKTEVKNMNSFSQLEKALSFEAARHVDLLERGEPIVHQTMTWDVGRGEARPMRQKEETHDYRYFPEPDLPELVLPRDMVKRIRKSLPELPAEKVERFVSQHGLPIYDAEVLCAVPAIADYFEAVADRVDAKTASNWVMGEVMAACNDLGVEIDELKVGPPELAELVELVDSGTLSNNLAKRVFRRMIETGESAAAIVEEENLRQVSDTDQLRGWVTEVLSENPEEVERFKSGEDKLFGFLMGEVMRKSRGVADPTRLRKVLRDALELETG